VFPIKNKLLCFTAALWCFTAVAQTSREIYNALWQKVKTFDLQGKQEVSLCQKDFLVGFYLLKVINDSNQPLFGKF